MPQKCSVIIFNIAKKRLLKFKGSRTIVKKVEGCGCGREVLPFQEACKCFTPKMLGIRVARGIISTEAGLTIIGTVLVHIRGVFGAGLRPCPEAEAVMSVGNCRVVTQPALTMYRYPVAWKPIPYPDQ